MNENKTVWYCTYCGKPNQEDARFCGGCGKKIAAPLPSWKKYLPAAAALVLALCAIVAWSLLGGGSAKAFVDVICFPVSHSEASVMIGLREDGRVTTAGMESLFDAAAIQRINNWDYITQIVSYDNGFIGLKNDGTVVHEGCIPPSYFISTDNDLSAWKNIKALYTDGFEAFGLTKDGRVLVTDGSFYSRETVLDYMSWTNISELVPFAYPEFRGVIGIQSDKTVRYPIPYKPDPMIDPRIPRNIKQVASSGYLTACLSEDGHAMASGMYFNGITQKLEHLQNIEQVAASMYGIACRLKDGSVCYLYCDWVADEYAPISDTVLQWQGIKDVQVFGSLVIGLKQDGTIVTASATGSALQRQLQGWDNIARIKVHNGYILGWQNNGNLLAAGIDLSRLS